MSEYLAIVIWFNLSSNLYSSTVTVGEGGGEEERKRCGRREGGWGGGGREEVWEEGGEVVVQQYRDNSRNTARLCPEPLQYC